MHEQIPGHVFKIRNESSHSLRTKAQLLIFIGDENENQVKKWPSINVHILYPTVFSIKCHLDLIHDLLNRGKNCCIEMYQEELFTL